MREEYIEPKIEVIRITENDIITTSGGVGIKKNSIITDQFFDDFG